MESGDPHGMAPSPNLQEEDEEVLIQQDHDNPDLRLLNVHENSRQKLDPGFRFVPRDEELILHYLKPKIDNEPLPHLYRITSVSVYKHNPQDLAAAYPSLEEDEWYFFTSRDRKYLNGMRPNRAAGSGYWKATGADKKIYHEGEHIGSKKILVFYEGKPPKGKKTNWIMHEYTSLQPDKADRPSRQHRDSNDMLLDNCVLCRIYKKSDFWPKEEKQSEPRKTGKQHGMRKKRVKIEPPQTHSFIQQNNLQVPVQQQNVPILMQHNLLAEKKSIGAGAKPFHYLDEGPSIYNDDGALDIQQQLIGRLFPCPPEQNPFCQPDYDLDGHVFFSLYGDQFREANHPTWRPYFNSFEADSNYIHHDDHR